MSIKLLFLLGMIFLHIVDDYYLQGWLASAKQKEWWEKNASNPLYKYDYIMALFMHSFSWTFSTMLIPAYYTLTSSYVKNIGIAAWQVIIIFILNLISYMITDNKKANLKKINLVQDQLIHICQLVVTWFLMVVVK